MILTIRAVVHVRELVREHAGAAELERLVVRPRVDLHAAGLRTCHKCVDTSRYLHAILARQPC